jgi:hypothetical protein
MKIGQLADFDLRNRKREVGHKLVFIRAAIQSKNAYAHIHRAIETYLRPNWVRSIADLRGT